MSALEKEKMLAMNKIMQIPDQQLRVMFTSTIRMGKTVISVTLAMAWLLVPDGLFMGCWFRTEWCEKQTEIFCVQGSAGWNTLMREELQLSWCSENHVVPALVNSGVTGNVQDETITDMLNIPLILLTSPLSVKALNCSPLERVKVTKCPIPLQMHTGLWHGDILSFMITKSTHNPVVLRTPWLSAHDHIILWKQGELLSWSATCFKHCCESMV